MEAYILAEADSPKGLVFWVNQFMQSGYSLQGGVSVVCDSNGDFRYTQAMEHKIASANRRLNQGLDN